MKKKNEEQAKAVAAMEEVSTPEIADAPQAETGPEKAETEPGEIRAEAAQTGNVMYIGPSIQNLIRHGTVFADGVLPPRVNHAVAELPAAAKLFVPVEEMPTAMKNLNTKNSVLAAVSDRMARKYSKR